MSKCLNCGAELKQIEGSREKKYCNDICRASYHQKKNRGKEPQYVKYSTFKELKDKFDKLTAGKEVKVADLNKPTDQIKDITKKSPETNYTIDTKPKEEDKELSDEDRKVIEFKIKEWQSKKYPSYMSKSAFEKMRDKEIEELKSKL